MCVCECVFVRNGTSVDAHSLCHVNRIIKVKMCFGNTAYFISVTHG